MASWNSIPLEIVYKVMGWAAFVSWSVSFYPQVVLNFRRKSVVGLNFDFVLLNLTKHSSYLIYNATLYFSSTVQQQYFEKYGEKQGAMMEKSSAVLQEATSQLPPETPIEDVIVPEDVDVQIVTEVLNQKLGRRHGKVVRCMGKAGLRETGVSSSKSST